MECNIEDLVFNIFNKSPQPQKSINLEFIDSLSIKDLFEFLLTFFTEGSKFKFGIEQDGKIIVKLHEWTDKELSLMKEYFNSISFQLIINIYDVNESFNINFQSMNYKNKIITNKTNLIDLKLPLNVGSKVYVISFNYLL